MDDQRTDEDRIIETLIIDGAKKLYEDMDFLPTRQSLYNAENVIPEYDDEIASKIEWCRPSDIYHNPMYFNPDCRQHAVGQGTLPDGTFLGTLMAICCYAKYDLIENIFASRPEDFVKYGIYTCRFYVDGEWVEVITDTSIPCIRNYSDGTYLPAYGHSSNTNELWVCFVAKAFAKAMGSYEEIPNIKVQKALLHLTGGSTQQVSLKEEVAKLDAYSEGSAWKEFKDRFENDTLVILMPAEKKTFDGTLDGAGFVDPLAATENTIGQDTKAELFIPGMLYSVVLCKDIGGYELVLMHNPWKDPNYVWTGEWSDTSNDWDLYPEILFEVEKDARVPWRRRRPNGYFWISFRNLVKYFNKMFCCKLFPNDKFNFYCVRGECRGRQAGGPLGAIRDIETVKAEAAKSRISAIQKSSAAVVIDGDASWFNNPQYRIHCVSNSTTLVYVSVVPLGVGDEDQDQANNIFLTVASSPKSGVQPANLWDISGFEVFATDKTDNGVVRVKGQETSIWGLKLDNKHYYHIVPSTLKRGVEGDFILRVFSSNPILMESINALPINSIKGEWRRVGDLDTTGGALKITHSDGHIRENPKWCQNPQYHLEIADPHGKDEMYLKICLRRTDKSSSRNSGGKSGGSEQKKQDATIGITITKAEVLEDPSKRVKSKQPKQNIMGEFIPARESSLKRPKAEEKKGLDDHTLNRPTISVMPGAAPKTIMRKLRVEPTHFNLTTTYSSKTEACVYFPKLPRSWIPDGIIIVPSLSEKGVKGIFELEIYSSEKVLLNQLPETYSRTIAGDWTESSSGGSHLSNTWKKNPKFTLKFHYPVNSMEPSRVRLTLSRHGTNWKHLCRKDTVGSMIGFYIFINRHGEMTQIYESIFSPDAEVATEPNFVLDQLSHGEVYTIMPTTFQEGKVGSFVLSILSEYEFTIGKEK